MKFKNSASRPRHLLRAFAASHIVLAAALVDGAVSTAQAQVPPVAIPPGQQLGRPEETNRSRGAIYRQGLLEERALTVYEREREGYEPLGARVADQWVGFAGAEAGYEFNDNIYTAETGKESDSILTVAPTLRLRSDMPLHQLNLDAGWTARRFLDKDSENTDSYYVGGNGRYDFSSTTFLFGRLNTARLYEDRGSPNAANGSEPTEYQRTDATAGFAQTVLRLTYQADLTWRHFDYKDVASSTGSIDQDNRDIDIIIGSGRIGWEWAEGFNTYIRGAYNDRSHFSTQTTERDSRGYDLGVGVLLSRPTVFSIDASVGFMSQDFENSTFGTVTTPSLALDAAYNLTPLTSLTGFVTRSIEETTTANASSIVQTVASVGLEHEIMYNLLGRASLSYIWSDFQGINREDEILTAGFDMKYLFSRNFYLKPSLQYSERMSPVAGSDYDQWRALLVLGAQL
ncbi:MAG: outer membrane beta-barrel protein [Alphaproteobacteria bacterium]